MKKPLIIATTVVVLASFVGALLVWSYFDDWVASGVRTLGPQITQTKVDVDSVKLSPRTGTGTIRNLVVGNPAPYQEPFALRLGEGTLTIDPASLTGDKVIIKSIRLNAPEINFEGGIQDNNLQKLAANMNAATGSGKSSTGDTGGSSKKLQVDEFTLSDAKVNIKLTGVTALAGPGTSVTLPTIRLTNLGTGPEGITPAALSKAVMDEIIRQVGPAVVSKVSNLQPAAMEAVRGAINKSGGNPLESATKALGGALNKKP